MIKIKFVYFVVIIITVFCSSYNANAVVVATSTGNKNDQTIQLSSEDIATLSAILNKANGTKPQDTVNKVVNTIANTSVNVEDVEKWVKCFTVMLKDTCKELNIAVNEFIKTPGGVAILTMAAYSLAGKDAIKLIQAVMDIVLCIPLWIVITTIIILLVRYFYGSFTLYQHIEVETISKFTTKMIKTSPIRQERFEWRNSDYRIGLAIFLCIIEVVITFICMLIIFVY